MTAMKFSATIVLCLLVATGVEASKPALRGEAPEGGKAAEVSPIGERFLAFLDLDKRQNATGPNKINYDIADPSCKNGVVSPDLKVCCTDECGSCGNHDLCNDPAAFAEANEKTGKLADNCCKSRVAKSAKSCDESHAPCVLNDDYAKQLKTYVFKRAKRHAMDDCNKAIEIARATHDLGVEKGEWLAKLFLDGQTVYEDAKDIAVNVRQLCINKIGDIDDEDDELQRKIDGASDGDKKVQQSLGMSNVDKWTEALELNKNQVRFYKMIIDNAKDVKGAANKGLDSVEALKRDVADVADIGIEEWQLKMDGLTGEAQNVYSDAEHLWQQWLDSSKDYDCGPAPIVEHAQTQCKGGNTKFSFKCAITCQNGYDDQTSVNRLRCLKQGKFGKELYGEWLGLATCIGRDCGAPAKISNAKTVYAPIRYPNFAQYNCHEGFGMDDSVHSDKAFSVQCGADGNYISDPSHKCVPVKCGKAPYRKHTADIAGVFHYTDVVKYQCLEGYTIDGTASGTPKFSSSCQANGQFTEAVRCHRVICGPPPDFIHTIDPKHHKALKTYYDSLCLDYNISPDGNSNVFMHRCHKGANQFFFFDEKNRLRTKHDDKCLDYNTKSKNVFMHPCHDGKNQEWYFDNHGRLKTKFDDFCLDYNYNNQNVFMYGCHKGSNQHWRFAGEDRYYNDVVGFSCRDGYSLDRSPRGPKQFDLICGSDGGYHTKGADEGALFPKCEAVSAGMTPDVSHGNLAKQEMFFGQSVWVSADEGFSYLEKPTKGVNFYLKVNTNGEFEGMKKFLPVDCGKPPVVTKATQEFEKDRAVYGDVLPYSCVDGYSVDYSNLEASKSFQLSCQSNALYSAVPGEGECVNINDCATHNCGPFGECVDLLLDYKCKCDPGFEQVVDEATGEKICGNINDCGPTACGPGKCHDKVLGFECECPEGHHVEPSNDLDDDDKTCVRNVCGNPPTIGHAKLEGEVTKRVFEDVSSYICNPGHTLSGVAETQTEQTVTCQADKSFSKHEDCKPVECGEHPKLKNADIAFTTGGTVFRGAALYKCNKGYSLDGTAEGDKGQMTYCNGNGQYSPLQDCHAVTCGEPNTLANAQRESGEVFFEQKVEYSCFEGYTLDGQAKSDGKFEIECHADGKFTKMEKCLPVVCGEPTEHINALFATAVSGVDVAFPSVTEVTCRDGYRVGGTASGSSLFTVKCLSDGQFDTYDKRECMPVECGPVSEDNFDHAALQVDSLDSCDCYKCGEKKPHNYKSGTCAPRNPQCSSVNAEASGCYTKAKVACDCATHKTTSPVGNVLNFEETAVMECEAGYTAGGEFDAPLSFPVECLANGELSFPAPDSQCRDVDACGQHNCGPYGVCKDVEGKDIHAYECECLHGYEVRLDPNGEKKCGDINDCEGKDCGAGTCIDKVGGYTCNCAAGHLLAEDKNGDKTCLPVQCEKKVPELKNGKMLSGHSGPIVFPESLRFECDKGYSTDGSVTDAMKHFHASCKADGTFYGMQTCQKVSCGSPWTLNDATVLSCTGADGPCASSSIEYEGTATYKCNEGYTTDESGEPNSEEWKVECQSNGVLTDPKVCHRVTCGKQDKVSSATRNGPLEMHYGDTTYINCDDGHTLTGTIGDPTQFERTCLADGSVRTTGQEVKTCKPMSLPMPTVAKAKLVSYGGESPDACEIEYIGCYRDNGWRDLKHGPKRYGYVPETCHEACSDYKYFALQNNGWCNCDNDFSTPDSTYNKISENRCGSEMTMLNGKKWRLGGGWANSMYKCKKKENTKEVDVIPENAEYGNNLEWLCDNGYSLDGGPDGATRFYSRMIGEEGFEPQPATECKRITYSLAGKVSDASNKNPISDVTVKACSDDGGDCYEAKSYNGDFLIQNVPPGVYDVEYSQGSFISETVKDVQVEGPVEGMRTLMSPSMASDQWRIVMRWASRPDDVDVDLEWGWSHVYYGNKNVESLGMKAALEVDVLDGYGPETVFLGGVGACTGSSQNCDIHYSLNDYYAKADDLEGPWGQPLESAVVTAYRGDTAVATLKFSGDNLCSKSTRTVEDLLHWDVLVIDGRTNELKWTCEEPPIPVVKTGLRMEMFYFDQKSFLSNLNPRTPAHAKISPDINYPNRNSLADHLRNNRKEQYAIRWTGALRVDQAGEYRFELTSDDGSKMWLADRVLVNNNGLHGMIMKHGTASLSTDLHAIRIEFFQKGGGAGIIFKYQGPDSGNRLVSAAPAFRDSPVLPGITEEVFYFAQGSKLPNLNDRKPNQVRVVDEVEPRACPQGGGMFNNFLHEWNVAVLWSGFIEIRLPGEYEFKLTSDDGSKLWLTTDMHDQHIVVVDNDGLHGAKDKSKKVNLVTGFHRMRMEYFQKKGGACAEFNLKGPDTDGDWIVPDQRMLFRDVGFNPVDDLNAGLQEEQFYFSQGALLSGLAGKPQKMRNVKFVNYANRGSGKFEGFNRGHDFAVRWTGSLRVKQEGTYTFYLNSDDGSAMWMGTSSGRVINNDGLHGMRKVSTDQTVGKITAIRIEFFQRGGGLGCVFSFKGADTGGEEKVVPSRNLLVTSSIDGLLLEAFYFNQGQNIPELRTRTPNLQRIHSGPIDFSSDDAWDLAVGEQFALSITGFINVEKAGEYKFYLNSDDGSKLWIENKQIVDNDGSHGARVRDGRVTLVEGQHALKIIFSQGGGGKMLQAHYSGPDTDGKKEFIGYGSQKHLERYVGKATNGPKPHCLKIRTGTKSHNGGRLIVQVKTGSNWETVVKDTFSKGSLVVNRCWEDKPQVRVKNDKNDAWTGSIYISADFGEKWSPLYCEDCHKTGLTNSIVVDGNSDSKNQADTRCWNKKYCSLTTDKSHCLEIRTGKKKQQ
jgi:hypothetical protein